MSIPVTIVDGRGSKKSVKVNGEGEIGVVIHAHPPIDEEVVSFPFRQYLTDDGTGSGSNDMIVDGSTTPQDFFISARQDRDIFIKLLSIRIGDSSGVSLDSFGGLSALTNGCDIVFSNNNLGEVFVADELKTNLDMVRVAPSTGAVGTGTAVYKLDISGGGSEDSYLPVIDLSQTFGFPWGLRLQKGSKDKIIFRINDALAGLVTFNVIGYGSQL